MPAASDATDLPVRFRPFGVRLVSALLAVMLTAMCAAIWVQFPDEVRRSFTLVQKLTLLLIALLIGAGGFALARCRVDADEDGLTVVNGYRRHRYDWGQVVRVTMRSGNPWAVLDLSDGTSQSAMGIQASDGGRAQAQVRRLRALIDAHAGTEPGWAGPGSTPPGPR
jgi:hypothetical protein